MGGDGLAQQADVALLHVAAILAQMDGDAVRAGQFAQDGGGDGIGLADLARLADGGDMIDVHAQLRHGILASPAAGRARRGDQ